MASTDRKFFICGNQFVGSDHATTTTVNLREDIPTYFRKRCPHSFISTNLFSQLLSEPHHSVQFRFARRRRILFNNFAIPIMGKADVKLRFKQVCLSYTVYIANLQVGGVNLPSILVLGRDFIKKCRVQITEVSATLGMLYYQIPAEAVQYCPCPLPYCNCRKPQIVVSE